MAKTPNWDDLKLLLAVGRTGSFSAAAAEAGVTQPTVGRRIRQLEARLGTLLFERKPAGHTLTDAGAVLFATATRIEESILAAERRATGHDTRIEGIVRATTVGILATEVIVPAACRLRQTHPAVTLEILSESRLLSLHRREADVALRPIPFQGNDIIVRRMVDMAYRAYSSPAYREAESGRPVLLLPTETQWPFPEIAWLIERFPQAAIGLRSDQRAVLLDAARRGLGIVCLPAIIGEKTPGLRRHIEETGPSRSLWLGVHRDLAQVPRVRAVLDAIGDELHARRQDFAGAGGRPPA